MSSCYHDTTTCVALRTSIFDDEKRRASQFPSAACFRCEAAFWVLHDIFGFVARVYAFWSPFKPVIRKYSSAANQSWLK